jgi:hypothetical protein
MGTVLDLVDAGVTRIVMRAANTPDAPTCPECKGTGWYGDNGPGIIGNSEFVRCECGTGEKCWIGCHPYKVIGGVAWCRLCNRQADLEICRIQHDNLFKPNAGIERPTKPQEGA